ncbi:MAG: nucleoside triphosphate pyrophosphohydrolase [Candidatus Methanoplasma sp.]|jgi:predicted house-cleaning noncanonical NTP pyrophosphatase (MazG superfamily)|nr:nucleoside triphosphate pyrophosphohydrolase [Candidatus Methanoplasma sp.]
MEEEKIGKLVRDKIPHIIASGGDEPVFRMMGDAEYLEELRRKLLEEVSEYMGDGSMEELADVYQVVCSIAEHVGGGRRELEYISFEKSVERGGFEGRVYLESVRRGALR